MSLRRLLPYFLILAATCLPMLTSSQTRRPALWFEGARLIIGDRFSEGAPESLDWPEHSGAWRDRGRNQHPGRDAACFDHCEHAPRA